MSVPLSCRVFSCAISCPLGQVRLFVMFCHVSLWPFLSYPCLPSPSFPSHKSCVCPCVLPCSVLCYFLSYRASVTLSCSVIWYSVHSCHVFVCPCVLPCSVLCYFLSYRASVTLSCSVIWHSVHSCHVFVCHVTSPKPVHVSCPVLSYTISCPIGQVRLSYFVMTVLHM